jgi:uncharacterized iron-regulated membrane protein
MNRTIHRWVSLPIAIIMLIVAISGIYLQFEEFGEGGGEGNRAQQAKSALPADAEAADMLTKAIAAARAAKPELAAQRIELNFQRGEAKVTIAEAGGRGAPSVEYNAKTGEAIFKDRPPPSLRGIMIGLHTGKTVGMTGLILVMLSGIILTVLSVTGLVVYYDMWRRRRAAGKGGLFW